jgi:DNA polymerase elongation subunit (family B)
MRDFPISQHGLSYLCKKYGQIEPQLSDWDGSQDLSLCVYHADAVSMPNVSGMDPCEGDGLPVVRLFGTTKTGVASTVLVRGFMPYIYVKPAASLVSRIKMPASLQGRTPSPDELDKNQSLVEDIVSDPVNQGLCHNFRVSLCSQLRKALNSNALKRIEAYNNNNTNMKERLQREQNAEITRYVKNPLDAVLRVELVRKQTVHGYHKNLTWMIKVTFSNPAFIVAARDVLGGDFRWALARNVYGDIPGESHHIFEASISYPLRYMIDQGIHGSSWITLPAGKYLRWTQSTMPSTRNPIEVLIKYDELKAHTPEDPAWSAQAPTTRLTIDIE